MSMIPDDLKYTPEHEWVRMEDGVAIVGITDHAQNALTDIVWIEFFLMKATVSKKMAPLPVLNL